MWVLSMTEIGSWARVARLVAFTVFISTPVMILTAYGIHELRGWLAAEFNFKVSDQIYLLALLSATWGAFWATTGRLISKLRKGKWSTDRGGPVV